MGAGMLNVPERVYAFRPFHVEQFCSCRRIAFFQFFDGVPRKPQPAATADAGLHFNAGDFQKLKFVIACWAIHINLKRPIAPDGHRLPLTVSPFPPPSRGPDSSWNYNTTKISEGLICADFLLKHMH